MTSLLLTAAEVAAIAARCEAATPGEWGIFLDPDDDHAPVVINAPNGEDLFTVDAATVEDTHFVCSARTDVLALLADRAALVERLVERDRLERVLRTVLDAWEEEADEHPALGYIARARDVLNGGK